MKALLEGEDASDSCKGSAALYEVSAADFLEPIRTVLQELDVPDDTVIVIGEERFQVYE